MSRSTKKGPYVADSLMKKVEAMNEAGKKSRQDLEPLLHHLPRIRRPHLCCP